MTINSDTLVTVDEAAQELGVKSKTIHKWIDRGKLVRQGIRRQGRGLPRCLVNLEEVRHLAYPSPE